MVTLTLTVTDNNGNEDGDDDITARDSVTITVRRGPTVSVDMVFVGDDELTAMDHPVSGGTVVNLLATSRSADVAGATRLWTATPNVGTFSNAAAEDTFWTAPAATTDMTRRSS